MQLNFLQEDLLAVMQKPPAAALPSLPLKPTASHVAKPIQTSLLSDDLPAAKKTKPSVNPAKGPVAPAMVEEKAPSAFKTISEAADILGVPAHVLRFWESQFSQISPTKSRGGRRYYRPEDMQVLSTIKHLLYKQGYTIKGARKALSQIKEEHGNAVLVPVAAPEDTAAVPKPRITEKQRSQLAAIRNELLVLKQHLIPYLA